jgi:Baseplate J-like protein
MACIILRPDPKALFDQIQSMFSATVLGGGKVIPESNEWYVVTNDYAMAEQYFAIADQMWRETNPETACCDNLYKMAAQHGVYPAPASYSEGYAEVYGTPGAAVPPSMTIMVSGIEFVTVGTIPLTMPLSGSVYLRIRALTPGAQSGAIRSGTSQIGIISNPPAGINPEVVICGGAFCGGKEAETCEEFRKRYLERLTYKPLANMAWIKEKLMEFPCVTRVCIREGACCRCDPECGDCGCKNCGKGMQFYVFMDGVFPCGIPPQHIVDDITVWLFGQHQGYGEGQVEIGVCGDIYVPIPLWVNVIIDIAGCPSSAQKQMIEDQTKALFATLCPSKKVTTKQFEVIIASIIGAEVNASVRFELIGYETAIPPYPRQLVFADACGLEPECDVIPCLNEVQFINPDMRKPPCG